MTKTARKRVSDGHNRSRITNGKSLLPEVDGRSTWARLFRDTRDALVDHVGGEHRVTEPQRAIVRRIATIEAECINLEAGFALARAAGDAPDASELDLYARLANSQRRFLELLGLQSTPYEPETLAEYIKARDRGTR